MEEEIDQIDKKEFRVNFDSKCAEFFFVTHQYVIPVCISLLIWNFFLSFKWLSWPFSSVAVCFRYIASAYVVNSLLDSLASGRFE